MCNAIHFLNTGYSDCIILESDNHFAMIDAGEDTEYPTDKPWLNLKGYEQQVCQYLNRHCADEKEEVILDFVLGTHSHSDHIGGFDTVINQPNVTVKRAFLKPYHEEDVFIMERKRWDNQEVYSQMKAALQSKNVSVIESFDNFSFNLGSMIITFFNGTYKKPLLPFGENVNSVVTLVEYNGKRALLAGDMNYKNGLEKRISRQVGRVDLLKVGHHGYVGSTSFELVRALMPKYAVVCNAEKNMYPDVKYKLKHISKSQIMCTHDLNGVKAVINNDIEIVKNIM